MPSGSSVSSTPGGSPVGAGEGADPVVRVGGEAGGDAVGRVGVEIEHADLPHEAVGPDRGDGDGDVVHGAVAAGSGRRGGSRRAG